MSTNEQSCAPLERRPVATSVYYTSGTPIASTEHAAVVCIINKPRGFTLTIAILNRAAITGALIASATSAYASDAAANAVYERMQAAGASAEPAALLDKVYAPGSTYLPGHKEAGIDRRDAVIRMMAGSQQHLRKAGGRIDLKFRVVDRKRFGDVYVDNGYMRTAVKPAKDAPEQVTYAKFATVVAKQAEGHWAFVTDADSETPAANFESARPVAGLKFDR